MKKDEKSEPKILRQKAEDQLKRKFSKTSSPLSETEMLKLIHELEVHQIELELQNDELQSAKAVADIATSKYTDLYDFAPSGYFTLSKLGGIIELNLTCAKMLGKERSKLINRTFSIYVSTDTRLVFNLFLNKVFKSKSQETCEVTLIKDGNLPTYVLLTSVITENEEQCNVTMVDITERKHAEEALAKSGRRLKEAQRITQLGNWEFDIVENKIAWSDEIYEILELDKDKVSSTYENFSKVIHPDDLDLSHNTYLDSLKNKISYNLEFRLLMEDGRIKFVNERCETEYDESGNPAKSIGTIQDITERKQAEEALRESEQRFKALHNASFGGIAIHDKGLILECNLGLAEISGYSVDELIGMDGLLLIAEETREIVMENISSSYEKPYEVIGQRKNGEKYPLRLEARTIPYKGKQVRVVEFRDITESKQTEEALWESEVKFRGLYEQSPIAIEIYDADGLLIDVNRECLEMFGIDDFQYVKGFNLFDDPNIPVNEIEKLKKGETISFSSEFDFAIVNERNLYPTSKSGKMFWNVFIKPLQNENGVIVGYLTQVLDITERKQVEEALRESEVKFRTVVEAAAEAIFTTDNKGYFVYANPQVLKLSGYSIDELRKLKYLDLIGPEYKKVATRKFHRQILSRTEFTTTEYPFLTKTGERKWFNQNVRLIIENEEVKGFYVISRDVTELRKSELVQKALFRISEEASKTTTLDELYKSLHGIIATLMPVKNFYIAIHNRETDLVKFPYYFDENDPSPNERIYSTGLTEYVLERKKSQTFNDEHSILKNGIIKKNGITPKAWIGIYLEFEDKYKGVLALQDYENENAYSKEDVKVLQFVSEQIIKVLDKRYADAKLQDMIRKLFDAKEELELINKNKDRFFSIIAHDLKAPFQGFLSMTQIMAEEASSFSADELSEFGTSMNKTANNVFNLLKNLLEWSQMQQGSISFEPEKLSLTNLIANNIRLISEKCEQKGIEIINEITEPIDIYLDENMINSVLLNLLTNSVKFSNRGCTVTVKADRTKNDIVEISISDTGIGMEQNTVDKLFKVGEEVGQVGTAGEKSSGLGLLLCKEFIEKHSGKIWVESKLGKGSTFYFTIK